MIILSIGRDMGNRIVINDPTQRVSGVHAELILNDDNSIMLKDMSRNGTFVNGKRLQSGINIQIRRNDVVSFANAATLNWALVPQPNTISDLKITYSIGTASDNKVQLVDSAQRISRYHADLKIAQNGDMFIYDKSSGGTYVNDRKITAFNDYPVKRGDKISFAKVQDLDWSTIKEQQQEPQGIMDKLVGGAAVSNSKGNTAKLLIIPLLLLTIAGLGYFLLLPTNPKQGTNPPPTDTTSAHGVSNNSGSSSPCTMGMAEINEQYSQSIAFVYCSYYHTVEVQDGKKKVDKILYVGIDKRTRQIGYSDNKQDLAPFESMGSGFYVADEKEKTGYVVTNRHVAEPWKYQKGIQEKIKNEIFPALNVYLAANGRSDLKLTAEEGEAEMLGVITNGTLLLPDNMTGCETIKIGDEDKEELDIALLRLNTPTLPVNAKAIPFEKIKGNLDHLKVGSELFTIGFPYGIDLAKGDTKDEAILAEGKINTSIDKDNYYMSYNMPTYNGASGSPIFDQCGNVVGIVTQRRDTNQYNRGVKSPFIVDLIRDPYSFKSKKRQIRYEDGTPSPLPGLASIGEIYFDYNQATIRPDAALELDKMADYLKKKAALPLR
ncbi:MAG: FHA domain-containing protein [Chitinophagales bacterium]|nr:FHA domain-containing protein [Chitinophagales bacterium]